MSPSADLPNTFTSSRATPDDTTDVSILAQRYSGSLGLGHRAAEGGAPAAGVCCASGGNHGAAVAWSAREAGLPATVFVPDFSPKAKTDVIESLGARLRRTEGFYADALAASQDHARQEGAFHIDAYDAPQTVTGQGTPGLELAAGLNGKGSAPVGVPVIVECRPWYW
ncbi:pyridoxal-phosphate dependent enzyme [Streptomyces sp. NPDC002144]|uniref:pyridoxal-phosphate dependent enzyme n=1 Tax=Streptomyces sp. NPDC006668 TaxID=3156903 RepID=UPI0034058266